MILLPNTNNSLSATQRRSLRLFLISPLLFLASQAQAQFVAGSTSQWTAMTTGGNGIWDPANDQQTGQGEGDFVGVANTIPSSYMGFINTTPLVNTDGTLYFRVRHRANSQNGDYSGLVWVGVDANSDGKIDIFAGINRKGAASGQGVILRNPGTGANSSPSTTTIDNSANLARFAFTTDNYNWSPVSASNYTGGNFDADGGGSTDMFQSFALPFQSLVTQLNTTGSGRPTAISITDTTPLRFVFATSEQDNSINQDYLGIDDRTYNPINPLPFVDPLPPTGIQVSIPEPTTLALLIPGLFFLRRRKK